MRVNTLKIHCKYIDNTCLYLYIDNTLIIHDIKTIYIDNTLIIHCFDVMYYQCIHF